MWEWFSSPPGGRNKFHTDVNAKRDTKVKQTTISPTTYTVPNPRTTNSGDIIGQTGTSDVVNGTIVAPLAEASIEVANPWITDGFPNGTLSPWYFLFGNITGNNDNGNIINDMYKYEDIGNGTADNGNATTTDNGSYINDKIGKWFEAWYGAKNTTNSVHNASSVDDDIDFGK